MPAYNAAPWIEEAIRSVLSQTYGDFELVVVDDGSSDSTPDIVRRFAPPARFIQRPHRGVAAARNAGIAASNGEIIAQLDADDVWAPHMLSTLLPYFQQPDVDVVSGAVLYWDGVAPPPPFSTPAPRPASRLSGTAVWRRLLSGPNVIPNSCTLFRRSAFVAVGGFDETLSVAEDFDLWLRLAHSGSVFVLHPEPLALLRRRPGSLSSHLSTKIDCHLRIVSKWLRQPGLRWRDRVLLLGYRRWRALGYRSAAVQALLARDFALARRLFKQCFACRLDGLSLLALALCSLNASWATSLARLWRSVRPGRPA